MKIGQPAVQNLAQFLARGFDPPIGQIRQFRRTRHPRDHRFYHPPSAKAENIADHRVELDVGLFQRLLNPLDVAGLLAGHLLVRAQQRAQLLERSPGTKLALIRPQAVKSAIHIASLTSVLRPGTFLMWAAFVSVRSRRR
jgi:hypothetical protein